MKKIILKFVFTLALPTFLVAQDNVYPVKTVNDILIENATIHIGNGQVVEKGSVLVSKGKIVAVGAGIVAPKSATIIDGSGKHLYPGLILSSSTLGLVEMGSSAGRPMNDASEIGEMNSNVRSIVAYNSDSKVINTLRSNGILLANVIPQGGTLAGLSTVVQLDAWNWEDAAYKMDAGVNFNMPELFNRPNQFAAMLGIQLQQNDPTKQALETIEKVKVFFREAKAYQAETKHEASNLKFEAVKGLFNKSQKLFINCNTVKQMLIAIDFVKEFDFSVVIIGGSDSWQIADLLKQNNIAVILGQQHSLPTLPDDDIDQPYKTATILQSKGVLFAINDEDSQNRGRNLPFNAGTAAAYGITKEEALSAITLHAAKILGIDNVTGSVEVGKDGNLILSEGDILDMRSSKVTTAIIQGRLISLDDKHKQLNERYKHKYGLK